jgi:hypothetical protein
MTPHSHHRATDEDIVDKTMHVTPRTMATLLGAAVGLTVAVLGTYTDLRVRIDRISERVEQLAAPRPDPWSGGMMSEYEMIRHTMTNQCERIPVRDIQREHIAALAAMK